MLCVLGIRSTDLPLSWGDNPGKGGQPGCNPPSPSGFSPPVPRFPPSPSPMGDDVKLHIPMMLHKTLRGEIWRLKSWEQSKNIRSPQEWGGLWKRERERKAGQQHTGIVHRMRQQIFSSERAELTQEYLPYCKEVLWAMRENLQADCVQSRRRSLRDAPLPKRLSLASR